MSTIKATAALPAPRITRLNPLFAALSRSWRPMLSALAAKRQQMRLRASLRELSERELADFIRDDKQPGDVLGAIPGQGPFAPYTIYVDDRRRERLLLMACNRVVVAPSLQQKQGQPRDMTTALDGLEYLL